MTATLPLRLSRRGAAAVRRTLPQKRRLQVHLRGTLVGAHGGPVPVDRRLVLRAR